MTQDRPPFFVQFAHVSAVHLVQHKIEVQPQSRRRAICYVNHVSQRVGHAYEISTVRCECELAGLLIQQSFAEAQQFVADANKRRNALDR